MLSFCLFVYLFRYLLPYSVELFLDRSDQLAILGGDVGFFSSCLLNCFLSSGLGNLSGSFCNAMTKPFGELFLNDRCRDSNCSLTSGLAHFFSLGRSDALSLCLDLSFLGDSFSDSNNTFLHAVFNFVKSLCRDVSMMNSVVDSLLNHGVNGMVGDAFVVKFYSSLGQ
jgi:hypothetical protein